MIDQKESKQVRVDCWLRKLLSRDMKIKTKTKNTDQPTNNHKNNRKIKAIRNIKPTKDHYHGNGQMGDTDS